MLIQKVKTGIAVLNIITDLHNAKSCNSADISMKNVLQRVKKHFWLCPFSKNVF